MTEIHLVRDGTQLGAHPIEVVNRMLANGQLSGNELAWAEGMAGWIPLVQMRGVIVPGRLPVAVSSSAATVSLVCGILAVVGIFAAGLGFIPGLVAVICGHVALRNIRKSGGLLGGRGTARAGLITGYIGLVICAAGVAVWVWMFGSIAKSIYEERNITVEQVVAKRAAFTTSLLQQEHEDEAAATPPASSPLRLVKYDGPLGPMDAYVSAESEVPGTRPAIVWLTGGFSNSIGEGSFVPGEPENDQSATSFQRPQLVVMYPSLRGGNKNPGFKEGFWGEVDDVLAAIKWLKSRPGVDPKRIYLGGHSTGGTLALLVAEASTDLRAVFVFGAVARVSDYGEEVLPFAVSKRREGAMRSPVSWLSAIQCPAFVIEGTDGNIESLRELRHASKTPRIQFFEAEGQDHFSIIQPVSMMLAQMILDDTGAAANLPVTPDSISAALQKRE